MRRCCPSSTYSAGVFPVAVSSAPSIGRAVNVTFPLAARVITAPMGKPFEMLAIKPFDPVVIPHPASLEVWEL